MAPLVEDFETETIPSTEIQWPGSTTEQLNFMKRVYDIGLERSQLERTFVGDLPPGQLATIEGAKKARHDTAKACKDLLDAARRGIQTAGTAVNIGVKSAYRSASWQFHNWPSRFIQYYNETTEHRSTLPGGEHGEKAAQYLAAYMGRRFAIPGFSLHQNGLAIDFSNEEDGTSFSTSTSPDNIRAWKGSWFWHWLENNAASFGFFQNTGINEPWHWEFRGRSLSSRPDTSEYYGEEYEEDDNGGDDTPGLINTLDTPISTVDTPISTLDIPLSTLDTPVSTLDTPVSTLNTPVSRSVMSIVVDLVRRKWIPQVVGAAIIKGERNVIHLTDMIFNYRHPERIRLGNVIRSTEPNYRRLRTEWMEIKTKIVEPIFQAESLMGRFQETSPKEQNGEERVAERGERDDAKGRMEWFFGTRISANPNSGSTPSEFAIASEQVRQMKLAEMETFFDIESSPGGSGTNNWTPLGPSVIQNGQASNTPPVSGRITSIASNSNGDRIYVGTANGGIWYSGDRGANWEPWLGFNPTSRADFSSGNEADSLSVGSVAVIFGSSKREDEVYVGTGEATSGFASYFGVGIKHYLRGNLTLEDTNQRLPRNQLAGKGIYKIVIDPSTPSRPFAATTIGLFRRNTSGVWEKIVGSFANANLPASDFVIAGTGASRKYYVAFDSDKVYEGDSSLTTWTALALPTALAVPLGRIALAASSSNASVVYSLDDGGEFFKLDGSTFRPVTGVPSIFTSGQGWYDIILGIDPGHDDIVYIGGDFVRTSGTFDLSLYKGTIRGTSPSFAFSGSTFVGRGIHPDGHAIAFSKDNVGSTQVWIGCDGGLFYSDTPTVNGSFKHRNIGISSAQSTYIAQWMQSDAVMFAGLQDNGVLRYFGEQVWSELNQGDGGGVAVDPNNEFNIMGQKYQGFFVTSNDCGANWSNVTLALDTTELFGPRTKSTEFDRSPFSASISSYYPSHDSKTMVAIGTDRLWLSYDWGNNWRTLPNNSTADRLNTIIAIKIAFHNKIFAATRTAVYRYDRGAGASTTWTRTRIPSIAGLPAGAVITAIEIDNATAGSFYIVLGGVGSFERCYHYDGSAWHAAGPPVRTLNIPCHAIVVDTKAPNNIYLGSDVGVWKGVRGANAWTLTWTHYSKGIPEAAITDLKIHQGARLLRAATHGRGVWEITIDETTGSAKDIFLRANPADSGRMRGGKRFPWVKTANDPTRIPTSSVQTVNLTMSPDIKVRPASLPNITTQMTYFDFGYNLGDQVRSPNWQKGDLTGLNQVFVQAHNRGLDIMRGSNIRVLLLMANLTSSGTSPDLPAGFTAHINSGDTDPKWLGSSGWKFADAAHPTKTLLSDLNVRTPKNVMFNVRFSDLTGLTATSKVALLAFITTINSEDKLSGTNINVEELIMTDKHVAQRYVVFT
ncbi:MAG TPA: D-alanyl-D-alanine carboxypeptidase family protein [Chitinophagales bacterium]|nr:D-alanyl-D-alanine carboxypeptidase family protein [Chitinophagales bacterium]